ncbi:winged helix-turn-helix transcriptional regulator [filamentous cyanobacterium LEGE 11480]|uniref:Winged helix-turn-helix transcriptional regulator n=1 Tax=Romeriopsis navalis LEGE 11480 TaxID=2777977 RepID=A0A928VLH3_9CYAN|nr:metalloregulator ArsR/SmtB family transcription factor [Romeriopsis navalis]MBE9028567.1 winged helix-turn-helix transcriptional regulator [Romeriopsis navalis LEGE 11480]
MSSLKVCSAEFCAHKFQILADTTRLSVLQCLMDGPKHVKELNAVLMIEQSLLSHHLKVLRDEGFVRSSRDGKTMLYELVSSFKDKQRLDLQCCIVAFDAF